MLIIFFRPLLTAEVAGFYSDRAHLLRQVDHCVLRGRVRLHRRGRAQTIDHKVHAQLAARLVFTLDSYFAMSFVP